MPRMRSVTTYKWAVVIALVLLLATTALAAAQSSDILLPFVTGEGTQRVPAEQAEPEAPGDERIPPLVEEEQDPNTPVGDSQDTHSGDYDVPAEISAVDAFNATQWTVQNNVGVGTDVPTADIDLARNVNNYTRIWVRNPNAGTLAQTQLYLNTASSNGLVVQQFGSGFSATWNGKSLKNMARLRASPTDTGLILTTGGAAPLILGTNDQERLRVTPDGKVGIGTTTPAHQLSIAGGPAWTSNGWFGAVELPNVSAIGWRANSSGISFGMGHTGGGFYFFRTASDPGTTARAAVYDLTISDEGNVGIGTISPTYKLHVNGGVKIDNGNLSITHGDIEVKNNHIFVDNGDIYVRSQKMDVPDYVFEPEYPLISLDELRSYVAEEKHLPNVPDAQQIAQGGLNLGEFQMKLLEKTEELTLYTLAQDEQLNSQQQEIESLQQDNQAKDAQLKNQGEQIEALQQMIADLETRLAALEEQE